MATNEKTDWTKNEIGCMWKRESATTKVKYLTGVINLKSLGFDQDVQIIAFSNKSKSKDTQPDLRVYLSDKKPTTKIVAKVPTTTKKAAVPVEVSQPEATGDNELL